uniref:Rab proteins geranylgeranyltransferase component A n=1 Tax=Rhabditophanes sp. KR3021 TaxID=114890 RepID=A0AC35U0B5_9BILA
MDESLPDQVDVIVLGTGLPECLLGAACSRAGKSVLTIDRNPYYGSAWSSFTLNSLRELAGKSSKGTTSIEIGVSKLNLGEGETFESCHPKLNLGEGETFESCHDAWGHDGIENIHVEDVEWLDCEEMKTLKERMVKENRDFNIDLMPKLLLSIGRLVNVLCDSEAHKYAEFVTVERLICLDRSKELSKHITERLQSVPYSKSDVFQTKNITMIEKRRMMKLLTDILEWYFKPEEHAWIKKYEMDFGDFLAEMSMTEKLKGYIFDIIAVLRKSDKTKDCLDAIALFLTSIGRFDNSPFLYPLYGCGDLPQAFSRLSALFEGVFILDRQIDGLIVKGGIVVGIATGDKKILCGNVVANPSYLPMKYFDQQKKCSKVLRAITISDKSIYNQQTDKVAMLSLPSLLDEHKCYVIESGVHGRTAPKGLYVGHFSTISTDKFVESKETFSNALKQLFNTSEESKDPGVPNLLTSITYAISNLNEGINQNNVPSNVFIPPLVDSTIEFDATIESTQLLFKKMFPDLDFLPARLKVDSNNDED